MPMLPPLEDPRRADPPLAAGERQTLEAFLDFHRTTLLLKCEGLTDEDRKRRHIGSSLLSLHGLVRHLTDVERTWFQWTLRGLGPADLPPRYWTEPGSDADFDPIADAVWEDDLQAWHDECESSREAARGRDLDHLVTDGDDQVSLRWIYVHMIEEYARHVGHADLLRELADGAVGD